MKRWLFLFVLFVLVPRAHAQPAEREVQRLIQGLGAFEFAQRERAARQLEKIGAPALELLHRAQVESADPEIRRRAELVIGQIERTDPGLSELREQRRIQAFLELMITGDHAMQLRVRKELAALPEALPHLQEASQSSDKLLRAQANSVLRQIQRKQRRSGDRDEADQGD
ncbi:MAG: hypothetical protein AB7K24_28180 [Gemmataceae bacterium]